MSRWLRRSGRLVRFVIGDDWAGPGGGGSLAATPVLHVAYGERLVDHAGRGDRRGRGVDARATAASHDGGYPGPRA